MKRLIVLSVSTVMLLVLATGVHAQDLLVPAGTLLQCTLNEPNFSSATASVGDPVLCHLRSFQEFGHTAFPRGSMLGGHLEDEKDPGHFIGKGYLKITFDRVIVPTGDIPLPAKVISAKGFKVDKQGDIKGKGHAKRDVVEWMLPPLWPWKVLMLPARGPRPTLKGEEPLQLRLMDDIVVSRNLSASIMVPHNMPASIVVPHNVSAAASHPDRPPYASSNIPKPGGYGVAPQPGAVQESAITEKPAGVANENIIPAGMSVNTAAAPAPLPAVRVTTLVLKSNQVLEVTKYRIDGGVVTYHQLNGTVGAVDTAQIDWLRTTQMTSEVRSVDLPVVARQTN
ncbi:MAG TPA: hypothetical protein VNY24_18255 [Candidatus Acidoferrales bacterium]|jgi:hypothetical protein|nr:hypothetical protein [Candidatus Acidoferrales bacterium]